jgi:hypothetical protein
METQSNDNQISNTVPVVGLKSILNQAPKHINIVLLLLGSVILFSVVAFISGIKYCEAKPAKIQYIDKEKIVKVYPTESPDDLTQRCGDIPMSILTNKGQFDVMKGPVWSSDCRHIVWSLWESGVGYEGSDPAIINELNNNPVPRKLSSKEGVFLMTDSNQSIQKIYNPKELNETPQFIRWENKDTIIFKAKNITYKYSISSKEQTIVEN